ncbi:TlpA disulfide reductase family protein [Arenibacter sp. M-2]|uniref:TlpA family protein disulfide reductase n=1 Tax=Arenibacter sp. M-2 TaxID=3053612 RepID=UPI002570DD80|nr:TlpA disulfide reductase family protein [Arenibacter sp. M-2]MDL5515065.1 TlpA disulfide reductase family protein [Arenibacter sp. M-2]
MRRILLIYMLFLSILVRGQDEFKRTQVQLEQGYPQVVKQFFDFYGQYGQSEVKTAQLATGIDTLQVYFGIAENKRHKFYWSAITNNDSLLTLTSGFPLTKTGSSTYEGLSELILGKDRPEKVKFVINLNENNNLLSYNWLNGYEKTIQRMEIIGIDKFKLGNKLPNLRFTSLSGTKSNTDKYQDKILVLNWWNTNCKPCISEMPGLNTLVEKYSKHRNIAFVAVADNTDSQVKRFLVKREFKYEQFVTTNSTKDFFDLSYPKHFIIGTDGKIKFFLEGGGSGTYKELDKALKHLIN